MIMPTYVMMLHDLPDPDDPQGRTYKQINAERQHTIPLGALVELPNGSRLFVVCHERDCDMTPLYYLSYDPEDTTQKVEGFKNRGWTGGWPEDSLKVIDGQEVAIEREACAVVAESWADYYPDDIFTEEGASVDAISARAMRHASKEIAKAIRGRGEE